MDDGDDFITIDRTSMVRAIEAPCEEAAYDYVIERLREACGEAAYVTWSGRTDDYLGVEVYQRRGAA
jgi:hypothetical protein